MTAPCVCAFTSLCREDIGWCRQYLNEAERLGVWFSLHLDRVDPCEPAVKEMLTNRLCLGYTKQQNQSIEFTEQHKQGVFDAAAECGFDWLMAWDIDETFEREAPIKLAALRDHIDHYDILQVRWANLWDDVFHVRTDGPFTDSFRVKFYNVSERIKSAGIRWVFDHPITNGARMTKNGKPCQKDDINILNTGIACLHHGLMTRSLRLLHKNRWDRIYTKAVGANPYRIWQFALDEETYPPKVERHGYYA